MKKLLVVLLTVAIGTAFAETKNVTWTANGTTYATSTCEVGGDLIIPQTTPTKYGYHFVGWDYDVIIGSWEQSGTPTPLNPIEPVFLQFGDTVLRAIGTEENFIADEYDPASNKITRRVGEMVLTGRENWSNLTGYMNISKTDLGSDSIVMPLNSVNIICSHFKPKTDSFIDGFGAGVNYLNFKYDSIFTTLEQFKQFLAEQYAAGTPVKVYYPLSTPTEESLSLSE